MKNKIVWGTCWYNENVETIVDFFTKSINAIVKEGFEVLPVVFDARYIHNDKDIQLLKKKVDNIKIILNHENVFPNKNYGVALITNLAKKNNCEIVAIVDPDWDIKERYLYIQNMLKKIINNDILMPNIGQASGRSNLLIGRVAIELFYPDYVEILKSPFPGALIAKTNKLYEIVNDEEYHFDWGGEWDIISLAIRKEMIISSFSVNVTGVRHRTNISKMNDSFQIWKSIFENKDILDRCRYIDNYKYNINSHRLFNIISQSSSIIDIINSINVKSSTKTEHQLLYMILYPIAVIIGELKELPTIDTFVDMPYDIKEIYEIYKVGAYCVKLIIKKYGIDYINKRALSAKGNYFSKWDKTSKKRAMGSFEVL